jgi:murein DD-endopeptidase MepM/ murein hydrolase activator NlpD
MPAPGIRRSIRAALTALLGATLALVVPPAGVVAAPGEPEPYAWPVVGPVLRGFEPPDSPFGAGHRGIDIGVPYGTPVRASATGTVAFAGWVAGSRFVSVDHPDGIRTTYSFLSAISVARGDAVGRGVPIGATGHGHSGVDRPHLHFGARRGDTYLDPLVLLGAAAPRVHLAPLARTSPSGQPDGVSGSITGLGEPPRRPHWLWSRAEPKPLVLPGRASSG